MISGLSVFAFASRFGVKHPPNVERFAMKTYPICRLLRSVPGVSEVRRRWFSDDRITFMYRGEPFVVLEAWGDSNRFWIGPKNPPSANDLDPLHRAFQEYHSPIANLVAAVARILD